MGAERKEISIIIHVVNKDTQDNRFQKSKPSPHHRQRLLAVEQTVDVVDDLTYVIVGNLTGPACANTLSTVYQHSRDDGNVPFWLYTLIVIVVVLEQVVIHCWEKKAGQGADGRERKIIKYLERLV